MSLVFVHGGVSAHTPAGGIPSLGSCLGEAVLAASALDAVEMATRALEDDPALNAGFGAVLTLEGRIELDAGIADGATGSFGGVATVSVRHPISLARLVMDRTPHVLLSESGAMAFADEMETLTTTTDVQLQRLEAARTAGVLDAAHYASPETADTVGCVALGDDGRLAAASSSGGVFGKMPGRVGDACIFGAGVYASPGAAVVGTGIGEVFVETLAAGRAGRLIEDGMHPLEACERTISVIDEHRKVSAGLLALDTGGRQGAAYRGGSWAVEGPRGPVEPSRVGLA